MEYTEDDPKPQLEEACKVDCLKEWHNYKVRPPTSAAARALASQQQTSLAHSPNLVHPAPLQACAERIKSDETGEAHCTGWAFDYWRCIDKCVSAAVASSREACI